VWEREREREREREEREREKDRERTVAAVLACGFVFVLGVTQIRTYACPPS